MSETIEVREKNEVQVMRRYDRPRLAALSGIGAFGQACASGTSPAGACGEGVGPTVDCYVGRRDTAACDHGVVI